MDSTPVGKVKILFEDNHILVVVKPAGMPSQADETRDIDIQTYLKQYLKEKYSKPGNVYLGLLHRLDRGVTGVMLFAKTSKAASRLSQQIQNHEWQKTYVATVEGRLAQPSGHLLNYLRKEETYNRVRVFDQPVKGGKLAELKYKVLKQEGENNVVEIDLLTGRPHQIRAQFAHIGHPIVGDIKYGSKTGKLHIELKAVSLEFTHPVTKEKMKFENI